MVRYRPDHKAASRAKIITAAARLFREHGYGGVGIDSVMAAAGLTRGAFYGHFRSKAALYRAVLSGEHDFITRLRARSGNDRATLAREGCQIARDYLAPTHRKQVLKGCSLAALAVDTARADRASRTSYATAVRELGAEFARGLEPGVAPDDPRILQAIALSVGGLLVASACAGDHALADAISGAAQDLVERLLSGPPG